MTDMKKSRYSEEQIIGFLKHASGEAVMFLKKSLACLEKLLQIQV